MLTLPETWRRHVHTAPTCSALAALLRVLEAGLSMRALNEAVARDEVKGAVQRTLDAMVEALVQLEGPWTAPHAPHSGHNLIVVVPDIPSARRWPRMHPTLDIILSQFS